MEKTVPHPYLNREYVGYVLNTEFSPENQQIIAELSQKFHSQFSDAIYSPPPEQLHVTLMDWLAPLVDYGRDKDEIFPEIFESYNSALEHALKNVGPIKVTFDEVDVGPEAIFLRGKDRGQYRRIRGSFIGQVALLPNTKQPPRIIHSTIARFLEEIGLQPVKDFAAEQQISITQTIDTFRLLRSTDTMMQDLKVLKLYHLK
jgi:hypothetical protein